MGIVIYMVIKLIIFMIYAGKLTIKHTNFILEFYKKLTFKIHVQNIESY